MPASETEPDNGPTSGSTPARVGTVSTRSRQSRPLRRAIGYGSYWIRGNVRLLTRLVAGVFAVAIIVAALVWLQGALDRLDPCEGLVPEPTSCDPPAAAMRYLQFGIAALGAVVAVAAAVLAARFAIIGREPRREPALLRLLIVVYFGLLIGWLIVVILSGDTTVVLEPEPV